MEILLWLMPAALATFAAMLVAGWVGREHTTSERQEEHAQERFAKAIQTRLPTSSVSPARPMTEADDQRIVVRPMAEPTPAAEPQQAPEKAQKEDQNEDTRRTA